MKKKIRVLLIAEACNPTFTSVPLVGYNFVRALAERTDLEVVVATHVRNKAALDLDAVSSLVTFIYVDNEAIARPLHKFSQLLRSEGLSWTIATAMGWPSYIYFEYKLYSLLKSEFEKGYFDVVHRVTPLTPTRGSPLARWIRTPLVLGPLNGGLPWPKEYPELRKQEREWLVPFRKIYKFLPYFRSTYKNAAAIISGSSHTASEIPAYFSGQKFYLPENGIDLSRFPLGREWRADANKFKLITVGRLVPYKGFDMILEAISASESLRKCELTIVGDGPQRSYLEERIEALNLTATVKLIGWRSQFELASLMRESHAFVFPSLREFGGGVVLEAMACGLPCIVADYGGPAELVNADCGILIPMRGRQEFVMQLQKSMEDLVSNPERCEIMSRNAMERVRSEFLWDVKAKYIEDIYKAVILKSN